MGAGCGCGVRCGNSLSTNQYKNGVKAVNHEGQGVACDTVLITGLSSAGKTSG